jgi:anhydro-N-acetylmuramic acid kinase
MRVAGLISGTSLDGIDVAIVDLKSSIVPVAWATVPYPSDVRTAILSVSNAVAHTGTVARLNSLLGELFAQALIQTCERFNIPMNSIKLIGSHGQTIYHQGQSQSFCGFQISSTVQISESSIIAERTGIPTVSDFRQGDMAAGGQGAPLVPFLDYYLFCDAKRTRIALNLGGIANITVIQPKARLQDVIAFDTGPSNMVLDSLAQAVGLPYDAGGCEARKGHIDEQLLKELLADPYYGKPGPKSAGREQYGKEFLGLFSKLSTRDALATATELTAQTVAEAISRYLGEKDVIVSGGGVHNTYLMERISDKLGLPVKTSADWGIPIDAKEAIAFAYLAWCCIEHRPSNVEGATGARKSVVLGKLTNPFPQCHGQNNDSE